jgi:hypothetical protein
MHVIAPTWHSTRSVTRRHGRKMTRPILFSKWRNVPTDDVASPPRDIWTPRTDTPVENGSPQPWHRHSSGETRAGSPQQVAPLTHAHIVFKISEIDEAKSQKGHEALNDDDVKKWDRWRGVSSAVCADRYSACMESGCSRQRSIIGTLVELLVWLY